MTTNQPRQAGALYWPGVLPRLCAICGGPILGTFVDGATVRGPWAVMHPEPCHQTFGVGFGAGRGQRYERDGARWRKVEG